MNHEINETNHFDRSLDLSNFGLDPQDPMHGATEKHHEAVGNPPEHLDGIATDSSGNLYLSGSTEGNLAGTNAGWTDTWVAKYDSDGNQIWSKQFGSTSSDSSTGIATDSSGNLYLSGSTEGDLAGKNAGSEDAWVAKYDSNGEQLWAKQFGSSDDDYSYKIATDSSANVYLTGDTLGNLASKNAGGYDGWVAKYDSDGNPLWTKQFGTSEWTESQEKLSVTLKPNFFYGVDTNKSATVTIADNEKPKVSIIAVDAKARETKVGEAVNPGKFRVIRVGDLSQPLTVTYKVDGTATRGIDYKLPSKIKFAAGVSNVDLAMPIVDDAIVEELETTTVTLTSRPVYQLAKAKSATVSIADNDK